MKNASTAAALWGGPEGEREGSHFHMTSLTSTRMDLREQVITLSLIYVLESLMVLQILNLCYLQEAF